MKKKLKRVVVGETWPPPPIKEMPQSLGFLDYGKKNGIKAPKR